jgi:23S rRNA pseudouridine2605 synthase
MRINQYIALATGISRRAADKVIEAGRVSINKAPAKLGDIVQENDLVLIDNKPITQMGIVTILLNKPVGYVCSREGQGSKTIYELLPNELHNLKPVGRLDKDSSGLLLLTNDGRYANELTHPKYRKNKIYEIMLDKKLTTTDKQVIENGIELEDGPSKLKLDGAGEHWQVTMSEGRNRQIRRTFAALGYTVNKLHRTNFGEYSLGDLKSGKFKTVK